MNNFTSFTKPLIWAATLVLALLTVGCGSGNNNGGSTTSATKAISAFSLSWTTGTPGSATGVVDETLKTIAVTVPYGTDVTAMKATYTTTGASVKVGAVVQVSTTTANNFTGPVAYVVTADNGAWSTYTVVVSVSTTTTKAITSFTFPLSTATTINETAKTIVVNVPLGTSVTALVATFTTSGSSVKIGTTTQVSGTTANNFTTAKSYVVRDANGLTATYTVTVVVATVVVVGPTTKAIAPYSLACAACGSAGAAVSASGTINEAATPKTIAVTVPTGTNVTALVATFTTTGASVKIGATTQVSGTTANDFTSTVAYLVTASDSTTATYNVTVTVGNPTAPTLGEVGRFVIFAPGAITTTGVTAVSDGDIGISPAARSFITGFTANGSTGNYTELSNGISYAPADANPAPFPYPLHFSTPVVGATWTTTGAMLTQASTDLGIADTFLAADPNPGVATQVCPAQLGTLTLTRGVYKAAGNVLITTGSLTLDAQGDPNAVFIFSIAGTLGTGAPGGNIILANNAQAKNVYWRTAGVTTIGAGSIFYGNVFATTQVNVLSGAAITGSLFAVSDRVTLIATTLTKAP
jgi:hypothetical protein